jgi:hypothetical protein
MRRLLCCLLLGGFLLSFAAGCTGSDNGATAPNIPPPTGGLKRFNSPSQPPPPQPGK